MPLSLGKLAVIIGCQWGDEGKGKLIDILGKDFDIIVRGNGGANAGHTIYLTDPENPDEKIKFISHLIPSGMFSPHCTCVIGNGVVVHLPTLMEEIESLNTHNIDIFKRLFISDRAHVLFDYHKIIDGLQEEQKGGKKVGTTKRGIGPCYTDKIRRNGIRMHDLYNSEVLEEKYRNNLKMLKKMYGSFKYDSEGELAELKKIALKIQPMIIDTSYFLNQELKKGKKILIEGANGTMLDIDHGTYPFVTSSSPSIGGAITGTGLPPNKITDIVGILKAYTTRVGSGPFPTEQENEIGERLAETGGEFGSTTGRQRRCGWFDGVVGKYSVMINGITSINLTKLDVLQGFPTLKIATDYKYRNEYLNAFPSSESILEKVVPEYLEMPGFDEDISGIKNFSDLPENCRNYVNKIEEIIDCKITSIGVGVKRDDIIFKD